MNNKMFFFVVKTPEAFGRDKYFRIKSKWNDAEECNNINRFCYGIRDRLKVLFQSTMGMKRSQSMPSQEKQLCPSHIKVFGMIIPLSLLLFMGIPVYSTVRSLDPETTSDVVHGVEVSRFDCVCPWWCPEPWRSMSAECSDRKP